MLVLLIVNCTGVIEELSRNPLQVVVFVNNFRKHTSNIHQTTPKVLMGLVLFELLDDTFQPSYIHQHLSVIFHTAQFRELLEVDFEPYIDQHPLAIFHTTQ